MLVFLENSLGGSCLPGSVCTCRVCVCVFSVCARGVCVASVMREVCACEASVRVHVHTCVDLLVDTRHPYKW